MKINRRFYSLCMSALIICGASGLTAQVAEAKPAKSKSLSAILKRSGLSATPALSTAFKSKKKSSKVQLMSAAPTIAELAEGVDLDAVFFGGALADVIGGSPSQASCEAVHMGAAACGAVSDLQDAMGTIEGGQVAKCYLTGMTKIDGLEISGDVAQADLFDPPVGDSDRIVQINIGSGEEAEKIIARVTAVNNLGSDSYKIALNFCNPENESHGGNLIRITKSGKYLATDANSEGEGHHAFTFSAKVKPQSSGKGIEIDPSSGVTISIGADHGEASSFFRNILVKNGVVTLRSDEHRGDYTRNAIGRIQFSGQGKDIRFVKAGFKFQDDGREGDGTVSWNSAQDRFVASKGGSNGLLGSIENEDLDDSFYEDDHELDLEIEDLPECDQAAEDIAATVSMDSDGDAMAKLNADCEPIRPPDGGLCFGNEDFQSAMSLFDEVCPNVGHGDGQNGPGGGGSGGQGGGGGPGEDSPE